MDARVDDHVYSGAYDETSVPLYDICPCSDTTYTWPYQVPSYVQVTVTSVILVLILMSPMPHSTLCEIARVMVV